MAGVLIQAEEFQVFLNIKDVGSRALHHIAQSIEFLELLISMVHL